MTWNIKKISSGFKLFIETHYTLVVLQLNGLGNNII